MRAVLRWIVVIVVFGTVVGGAAARASVIRHRHERLGPADRVVLGSSFQAMTGVTGVAASGGYLLLGTTVTDGFPTGWVVVNQRTGARTALGPQCRFVGVGPTSVLMSCPLTSSSSGLDDVELYSLADGSAQAVTPSSGLPPPCPQPDVETVCTDPAAVGADWIRWDASCYNCTVTSYFQNIETGQLEADPTNATTFADLNSSTLAHKTCPGVRLLPGDFQTPWGSLTYDGQFALVTGAEVNVDLERCGTRLRRVLVDQTSASTAVAWNAGAVVWQAVTGQLSGLFLPSLQRFTIPLPSAIVKPLGASENTSVLSLELTSGELYVADGWDGTFWRTAGPTALPLNTRRPSLKRLGNELVCRRGRWRHADRFSYGWVVNGIAHNGAGRTLGIAKDRNLRRASCTVTASNGDGTTTASSARLNVRRT